MSPPTVASPSSLSLQLGGESEGESTGALDWDREFAELDNEISHYESNVLQAGPIPNDENSPKHRPTIRRLLTSLKSKFSDKHAAIETPSMESISTITCRLCENPVPAGELESHTEWCSKFQECILKKLSCAHYLNTLHQAAPPGNEVIRDFISRALAIDEQQGKPSAVRLAKLLYKMAKIDDDSKCLKRVKYLVT